MQKSDFNLHEVIRAPVRSVEDALLRCPHGYMQAHPPKPCDVTVTVCRPKCINIDMCQAEKAPRLTMNVYSYVYIELRTQDNHLLREVTELGFAVD